MWLAHLLTLSRLPLAAAFAALVGRAPQAIAVLIIAGLTDVADGRVARAARARGERERWPGLGSWLDPLCDKTFVLTVLIALYLELRPPPLLLFAIAARELILLPLTAIYRLSGGLRRRMHYDFRAGWVGKLATFAQFAAVTALILRVPVTPILAAVAGGAGLVAAVDYVARGVRLARGPTSP